MDKNEGFIVQEFFLRHKFEPNVIVHYKCATTGYQGFKELPVWDIIENALYELHEREIMVTTTFGEYAIGHIVVTLYLDEMTKARLLQLSEQPQRDASSQDCRFSPFFPVVAKALKFLENKQDVEFNTNRTEPIFFIVKCLEDAIAS